MATKPEKAKKSGQKQRVVVVPPHAEPVLEKLVDTYGTYANVIAKALDCLDQQQQQHGAAAGQS